MKDTLETYGKRCTEALPEGGTCDYPPPCPKVRCANCGVEDFKCEMRRSLRLVLTANAPENHCYFCPPCYRSEGPDEC